MRCQFPIYHFTWAWAGCQVTRTHIHACTRMRTHVHTHTCTHTRTHAHTHTSMHAHVCAHVHTHTCTHTRTHACTHTHTHTHKSHHHMQKEWLESFLRSYNVECKLFTDRNYMTVAFGVLCNRRTNLSHTLYYVSPTCTPSSLSFTHMYTLLPLIHPHVHPPPPYSPTHTPSSP